jgi:peptidoglycan/LPS O-acetylase OafA/YrhL
MIWPALVPGWTLNYEMFFCLLVGVTLLSRICSTRLNDRLAV